MQELKEESVSSTLVITDGSTVKPVRAISKEAVNVGRGTTVEINGVWRNVLRGSDMNQEKTEVLSPDAVIDSAEARVIGEADSASYPLNQGNISSEALRRIPHLRIRMPYFALLTRFRSVVVSALTTFFDSHPDGPFYQVHLPIITWTDCEGGAEVFSIFNQKSKKDGSQENDSFFGGRRFLQVTAALHGEPFVQSLDRVWTLAPCFRAEVNDDRHLSEFWMLEVAMNNITELGTLFDLMETMIKSLVEFLQNSAVGREMLDYPDTPDLEQRWTLLLKTPYHRISVKDAIELLKAAESAGEVRFSASLGQSTDIQAEHELYLAEYFHGPVFLTHFYSKNRLFTALQASYLDPSTPPDAAITESFDLLLPGIGEICSGGLREHRLDALVDVMRTKGFFKYSATDPVGYPSLRPGESLRSLEWFADLRRWGTTAHGGYGIGLERLLMYLSGAASAKDTISFPRYSGVCGA